MTHSKKKNNSIKKTPKKLSEEQVIEIIGNQPEKVRESITKTLVRESISYSGPIPHPSLLAEFDNIIPNGADRIMVMAEKQLAHRIDIESKVVVANNRDSLLGVIIGGIIGFTAVVGALILILNNKDIQGFSIIIGTITTLVGTYIYGSKKDKEDLNKKND